MLSSYHHYLHHRAVFEFVLFDVHTSSFVPVLPQGILYDNDPRLFIKLFFTLTVKFYSNYDMHHNLIVEKGNCHHRDHLHKEHSGIPLSAIVVQ
jgi:hypothetical protein